MPRQRKVTFKEKPWKRTLLVFGAIGAILTVLVSILDFPAKLREFVGPTITPTSISYGNRCKRAFDNNNIEYVNLPELRAYTKEQMLQLESTTAERVIGIDLGCGVSIPFAAQVQVTKVQGDLGSFICLAFGGEVAELGTLEKYYAFCVSDDSRWLLLYVNSQSGVDKLQEGQISAVPTDKSQNLLGIEATDTELKLILNGNLMYTTSVSFDDSVIGIGLATPPNINVLPVWRVDNLNVWQLDRNAPPTSTNFSLAAVKVSFQIAQSLTPSIETPQVFTDLAITTPIQIPNQAATFVLLDRSGSVLQDPENEGFSTTLMKTLIGIAPPDDLIGMGIFTEETRIVLPLTQLKEIDDRYLEDLLYVDPFGHEDNLPLALVTAYEELHGQAGNTEKRVVVVTDSGIMADKPEQEMPFRQVLRQFRNDDIQLDIIVLQSSILPIENRLESLLRAEDVDFAVYDPTRLGDIPGVAMDSFYKNYTNRPGELQFTLDSPGMYQLAVPPNAEKFVLFLSSQSNDPSAPSSAMAEFTTPSGGHFGNSLESGFEVFTQQNPEAGIWTIELSSSQAIVYDAYSLMLLSSNP